jgi:LysM repeat protein
MLKRIICILVLVFTSSIFAQNVVKHTVAAGETIQAIAQKYRVTPYDIYKLNPDSQSGIKVNSVLLIPKSTGKTEVKSDTKPTPKTQVSKTHEVKPKETLYSITKLYNITLDELEANNPFLKSDGLQPGQILALQKNISAVKPIPSSIATVTHEVQPKETKYGIATKYGMTVEELERLNPEIVENLPIGFQLKVKKGTAPQRDVVEVKPQVSSISKVNVLDYQVKQGETMYSLTRQFGLSESALTSLNPELKDGVKEGMTLKVPANVSFSKEVKNNLKDLSKSISNNKRKELVLFLPFNASKIQNDTITSISERLKKDKFFNMTLDFYSGALMAIDSAKVLGINMDVRIIDSQESMYNTSAVNVISNGNFSNTDAVIGPFYQVNVEKVASVLESKNIPVISPLSKDYGKSYSNLYQSMPNSDAVKNAMFDYMRAKNGNIIAVIDPKKNSIKEYIQNFQSDTKIIGLTDKSGIVGDSIKKHFVKDRMNYVIMASEKTGTIFTITNTMQNALKEYQVQLVILEENPTLEFEEIALSRLTKLKMTYPSVIKDNDSEEALRFERAYRKKNKVIPNQYAIRGFDVTFDTMLRLAQEKPFVETLDVASEQVESKFDYDKKLSGGFTNNGIYILYYDTDLTIKQAQ